MRHLLALFLTLVTGLLLAPGLASADQADDSAFGPDGVMVDAAMRYSPYGAPNAGKFGSMRLMIERDHKKALDFYLSPRCDYCVLFPGFDPVRVINLDATPEPEVIFNVFSGGAHCCTYSVILRYQHGRYRATNHFWGNGSFGIRNLGGKRRFISRDDRFAYRFDCYACSGFPIQIWAFKRGKMVDVTKRHPNLIRRDANRHKRHWKREARHGQAAGAIGAWVADRCLLNRCPAAMRKARRLVRKGAVDRAIFGKRKRYVRKLEQSIRRFGYRR